MQWIPLLPKEGGLIQVDIGGHPPIPRAQKTVFHIGSFSAVFRVPNFLGCFEALNDVFWGFGAQMTAKISNLRHSKIFLLGYTFPTVYRVPQTGIVCKSYAPGKLAYQLPPLGPANLLDFHLPGLGFWILVMLKIPLEPHCNNHLLSNASSHHISSQR
jgi:hypothetical protein